MELLVVAHRGNVGSIDYNENFPDNSFEGIKIATSRKNIAGIEIDLRLTNDGELILCHEPKLDKVSSIKGNVSETKYDDITYFNDVKNYYRVLKMRSLILQDGNRIRKIIDEKVSKTITPVKAYQLFNYLVEINYIGEIIIELKEQTEACKEKTIQLIEKYKDKLNLTVHSYDIASSIEIGKRTGIKCGALLNHWHLKKLSITSIKNLPVDFYSIIWPYCTANNIKKLIDNGKDIYVWTVDSSYHLLYILNELEKIYDNQNLLPDKVVIISNVPDLINSYLDSDNKQIKQKYLKLTNRKTNTK